MPLLKSLDTRENTGGILVFKDDNFVQSVPVDIGYVDPLRKVVVGLLAGVINLRHLEKQPASAINLVALPDRFPGLVVDPDMVGPGKCHGLDLPIVGCIALGKIIQRHIFW